MKGSPLSLRAVRKHFGNVVAVRDLNLEVEAGTFVTLLGPSGCGKTTTLNMIAGFETPDAGVVVVGDRDISHLPPYRRPVNTVFQGYALFPHLDVFGNVAFGLRMKRVPKAEIETRVKRALEIVRLGPMEKRKPSELSGGQQQRVALARAFVNAPEVLLLDEPLSALDAQLRKQMQIELKVLQQELGITFIYVTHDQEEALVMSDVVCVMKDGEVEQIGPPELLYDRPASPFVARFLGRNNFLEGNVVNGSSGSELQLAAGLVIRLGEATPSGPAIIAIRPEKLQICDPDPGGPEHRRRGRAGDAIPWRSARGRDRDSGRRATAGVRGPRVDCAWGPSGRPRAPGTLSLRWSRLDGRRGVGGGGR